MQTIHNVLVLLILAIQAPYLLSFIYPRPVLIQRKSICSQSKRTAALSAQQSTNNDQYSPDSTEQISQDFRSVYTTLREKGPVFKKYSPTVKFTFVTPPLSECVNWNDVLMSDADIMTKTSNSSIFTEVTNRHGNNNKPIAIYLPGLDGFGISAASNQFNDLSKTFELWRLTVLVDDRSSFHELVQKTVQFIKDITENTNRPVYIIGESFGGMLAAAVALQVCSPDQQKNKAGQEEEEEIKKTVDGIVLINPATSFDSSSWDVIAPLLTTIGKLTEQPEPIRLGPFKLPSVYSVVGGLALAAVIPSQKQYQKILDTFMNIESLRDPSRLTETISGFLDTFEITSDFLPPDLLEHRIKNWLFVGSSIVVDSRLKQLDIPSLIVVGEKDNLLSSKNEANRLTKLLPQSQKLIVKEAGHFVLDENVNLTEAIIYSKLDPLKFAEHKKKYDPILDWKIPSNEELNQVFNTSVKQLEDAFSPIWMSTNKEGKRSFGLGDVPNEGPILFVSNHQLLGLDLSFLVAKLYKNGIPVRGLAHPVIFQGATALGGDNFGTNSELGRVPGIEPPPSTGGGDTQNFEKFGAVMVTPKNFYRLMQTGQNALLFPGGVREVFHGKNESYQLFWPEKVDFVRTAARFNATIVPISAVGMADSFNYLLESDEILNLPIIGQRAKDSAKNVTAARFDMNNEDELFVPPLVTPSLPSRNYFIFGKPVYTHEIDPKDKDLCKETYLNIQDDMNLGFHRILEAREKDSFKDGGPRLAYEKVTGRQAPTFRIEEINQS